MSTISTAYDNIITQISTSLPNHVRLSNPYNIEENPDPIMVQSFGLAVSGATNLDDLASCQMHVNRIMIVVITRKMTSLNDDPVAKATAQKLILEDHFILLDAFERNATLSSIVIDFKFLSDNGLEFVRGDNDTFMMVQMSYNLNYIETFI